MMQTSLNIKFGYPNAGLTLRWGESRISYAQVRRGWYDTFEPMLGAQVIIGNQAELARQVLLVWTILGERKTTIVTVPPLGNQLGSTIGDIGRPSDWVPPDPATANFGEASVWLDLGRSQNRNPATCLVELPAGGLSLSREITCTDNGAFDQIGDAWQEVNREETSSSYGDTSIQWPSKSPLKKVHAGCDHLSSSTSREGARSGVSLISVKLQVEATWRSGNRSRRLAMIRPPASR